ncbi:hypothetical protein BDD12DRAFT_891842 [Trichophaea hybrida]|nr:hypothetical protein BDD12DRAFT_891842 [Trichophaea hybrida]
MGSNAMDLDDVSSASSQRSPCQKTPNSIEWTDGLNAKFPTPIIGYANPPYNSKVVTEAHARLWAAVNYPNAPFPKNLLEKLRENIKKSIIIAQMAIDSSSMSNDSSSMSNDSPSNLEGFLSHLETGNWYSAVKIYLPLPEASIFRRNTEVEYISQHWGDDFQGRALEAFMEKLKTPMTDTTGSECNYYSKSFDILQSSGIGKSRLVREMGFRMLVISFALRRPDDTGFPPSDPEIFDFLNQGNGTDMKNTHTRALSLLGGLVQALNQWMDNAFSKDLSAESTVTDEEKWNMILKAWNSQVRETPEIDMDGDIITQDVDYRYEPRQKFCGTIVANAENIRQSLLQLNFDWKKNYNYESSLEIRKYLHLPLQKLIARLPKRVDGLPMILVAFDEAANLYPDGLELKKQQTYQTHNAINRVLRSIICQPLWVVYMSTQTRIDLFVARQNENSSARVQYGPLQRLPPFMSFELHLEERKRCAERGSAELLKPISQYRTVDHMTGFGRPLWRIYAQRPYSALAEFAMFKLLRGNTEYNPRNVNHVFAAIASRISIDLTLNDESLDLARDAVNSHLRLLIAVDGLTGLVRTSTPSEPVVADSVANALIGLENSNTAQTSDMWTASIRTFTNQLLSRGMVDKGTHGELYAKFVLILSRDVLAAQQARQYSQADAFILSGPLCYKDFLQNTFGDSLFTVIQATMINAPNQYQGIDVDSVLELAHVNINHFTYTKERLPTKRHDMQLLLLQLFRSNAALQLHPQQQWWDLLIPVYHGDLSTNVDLEKMSALLIQVKNRIHKKAQKLSTFSVQSFGKGMLVLCIQLELGDNYQDAKQSTPIWPKSGPCVVGVEIFGGGSLTFPFLKDQAFAEEVNRILKEVIPTETELLQSELCNKLDGFRLRK